MSTFHPAVPAYRDRGVSEIAPGHGTPSRAEGNGCSEGERHEAVIYVDDVPFQVTYRQEPCLLRGRRASPIICHMLQDAVPAARPTSPSLFVIRKYKPSDAGSQLLFKPSLARGR